MGKFPMFNSIVFLSGAPMDIPGHTKGRGGMTPPFVSNVPVDLIFPRIVQVDPDSSPMELTMVLDPENFVIRPAVPANDMEVMRRIGNARLIFIMFLRELKRLRKNSFRRRF